MNSIGAYLGMCISMIQSAAKNAAKHCWDASAIVSAIFSGTTAESLQFNPPCLEQLHTAHAQFPAAAEPF
jgi:hypothetical protein